MFKILSNLFVVVILLFVFTSSEIRAQDVVFFDNQNSFNNSCSEVALEDFEDTNLLPNSSSGCTGPFNSFTDNDCYSPGALIPGFSINAIDPQNPAIPLVTKTPSSSGFTNVGVGPNFFVDDLEITFNGLVLGTGLVLTTSQNDKTLQVRVFGEGNGLLGTTTVNVVNPIGTFLGVLASEPISRIEVDEIGATIGGEFLYELSFGSCGIVPVTAVPTLSEWGLISMAGILGIVGFMVIRRRKVTA